VVLRQLRSQLLRQQVLLLRRRLLLLLRLLLVLWRQLRDVLDVQVEVVHGRVIQTDA
jgi:hypothetical protein